MSTHPFKVGDRVSAPDGYFADGTSRPHREGIICSLYGEHQTPQVRFTDRPDVIETVAAAALCLIETQWPLPVLQFMQIRSHVYHHCKIWILDDDESITVSHEHLGSPYHYVGPCAVILSTNETTATARKLPLTSRSLWDLIRENMVAKHPVQS